MPSINIDSELVPQANDLAKVFLVGSHVAKGSIPTSDELRVDPRQVDYYLNAARALGIVVGRRKEELRISEEGRQLLIKSNDKRILLAARMFEKSKCGVEWLRWAAKPSLITLSPDSAEEFVRNIRGLSGETVGRRAQTLAAWLREFQVALSAGEWPRPSQLPPTAQPIVAAPVSAATPPKPLEASEPPLRECAEPCEAVLREIALDFVAMPLDEEGQRKMVFHVKLERSSGNRARFLEARRKRDQMECEACKVRLENRYGPEFEAMFEVHHRKRLSLAPQTPSPDDLALLCPTCHRAVHYRRLEPMEVRDLENRMRASLVRPS